MKIMIIILSVIVLLSIAIVYYFMGPRKKRIAKRQETLIGFLPTFGNKIIEVEEKRSHKRSYLYIMYHQPKNNDDCVVFFDMENPSTNENPNIRVKSCFSYDISAILPVYLFLTNNSGRQDEVLEIRVDDSDVDFELSLDTYIKGDCGDCEPKCEGTSFYIFKVVKSFDCEDSSHIIEKLCELTKKSLQ